MNGNIRPSTANGKACWVVDFKIDRERKRKFFPSEAQAEDFLKGLNREISKFGTAWAAMPAAEQLGLSAILAEIKAANFSLAYVWQEFQRLKEKENNTVTGLKPCTLEQAIKEHIAEKIAVNDRPKSIEIKQCFLRFFARGKESLLCWEVTPEMVDVFFAPRIAGPNKCAPDTLVGDLRRVRSFFNWCAEPKQNYRAPNTNPTSHVAFPKFDRGVPFILTPEQARTLMTFAAEQEPRMIVYYTLGLFAGVRPEELERLTFGDIKLEDQLVKVLGKTRRYRISPLPSNAVPWLNLAKQLGQWGEDTGSICPSKSTMKRIRERARVLLGWDRWPHDALRHSTASYRVIRCQSKAQVALELGNSEGQLDKHYLQPVTPKAAEAFYGIVPDPRICQAAAVA